MQDNKSSIISCVEPLSFPMKTLDPFLFCVYHKDNYPAGNERMEAPRRGNGADFDPNQPYRMYHGDRIPGFPQHPHRGFETVTATMEGLIDHTDSIGNGGRYGQGDLQWMTAGRGVVHGEMFPLVHRDKPNKTRFFQIWLNLPARSKMVEPAFAMHWNPDIPRVVSEDGKSTVTVWAGEYQGKVGLPPPPNSWASNPSSEVGIFLLTIQPGGTVTIPAAAGGLSINRNAYFVEGSKVHINGGEIRSHSAITILADQDATFENRQDGETVDVLILQGKPIGEPVAQHGPFVMNTMAEIQQAFADYRRTQFGGWPWPQDAMVFPADKTRFSLMNGKESVPSDA